MSEERKALERLVFRLAAAALLTVLAVLLVPLVWDYLSPFIIAVPLAALASPAADRLQKRLKLKRTPAVLLPVVLICLLVTGGLACFAAFGVSQLSGLVSNSPPLIHDAVTVVRTFFDRLLAVLDAQAAAPEVVAWLRSAASGSIAWLTEQLTAVAGAAVGLTVNMAAGIPYALIYANFLIIGVYFITRDFDRLRARLPFPRRHDPRSSADRLFRSAIAGLTGYLRLQMTYGLLSLLIGFIWLQAFGFRYAWLLASLAGTLEFLPLFGNGTLYIPWSVLAYLAGDSRTGSLILALYLLLITIRRVTEPRLLSSSIGVSPLASLVGMFAGLKAGGLLGLIGGPVVMSVLSAVWAGHILDPTFRDLQTIADWLRRRLDLGAPAKQTDTKKERSGQ